METKPWFWSASKNAWLRRSLKHSGTETVVDVSAAIVAIHVTPLPNTLRYGNEQRVAAPFGMEVTPLPKTLWYGNLMESLAFLTPSCCAAP